MKRFFLGVSVTIIIICSFYVKAFGDRVTQESSNQIQNNLFKDAILVKFNYQPVSDLQAIIASHLIKQNGNDEYTSQLKPSDIGLFYYDVDDDKIEEIFVYINYNGYCGSHGCTLMVLKPKNRIIKSFEDLTEIKFFEEGYEGGIISHDYVLILKSKTKGFKDLVLYANDYTRSTGNNFTYVKYEWQGKYYDKTRVYPAD